MMRLLLLTLASYAIILISGLSIQTQQKIGNVLILDHLNINHEQGRQDWLKAFYFDFLQCAIDPRKEENLEAGSGTVWANIGANQFHLPQGKPDAQVLDGCVTLAFPSLAVLESRLDDAELAMAGSKFEVVERKEDSLVVKDPWGSIYRLVRGEEFEKDPRGSQPGGSSEGLAVRDLSFNVPNACNLPGIARFYTQILECPILELSAKLCTISVGPMQTLTFRSSTEESTDGNMQHCDLRDDEVESPPGIPKFLSNYGPHVSMYVADLTATYQRAHDLGLAYVNPRFKRRAYNLQEALDDCMFRILDIIDPDHVERGPILKLEHEVRGVIKPDGSKYKSCPFDEIPASVVPPGASSL